MIKTVHAKSLRNSMLFKDVSEAILQTVAASCQPMELEAEETLFHQDDAADAMYILESGQVHIIRSYPDGAEVILATESPYYVIGELSMLANQPRTGSVVAVSDCELIKLSRSAFEEACDSMPEVAMQSLTHLGERLYRLNLQVRESAVGNLNARLASVVLMLSGGNNGLINSQIQPTRLARATAMDTDQVEQLLKQWTNEGIIKIEGSQITVNDVEGLQKISG